MESVENFMEIFSRAWRSRNIDALVRILKDAPNYLQNVSKNDTERALEIIFDEERGLLKFIQTVLSLSKDEIIYFNMPLKESFYTLQFIMKFFQQEYEQHIMQTRDICFNCIKTFCWYYIRKAAAESLKILVELFADHDMQLDQIIEHYNNDYLRRYNRKEGCVFYIILGAVARYSPKTKKMAASANTIFSHLLNDFKYQFKPMNVKQPEEIKIYLECLVDMLVNFEPFENDSKKLKYFENLYYYLSELCEPNKAQKVYRDKTIYLLRSHMKYFAPFMFKDYKKWHTLLNNILDVNENYTAKGALRAFYKIMALHLLKDDNRDVFLYFKNFLTFSFCNKNLSSGKLRLIISALGEFSPVYAKYSRTEIYELFQLMAFKSLPFYEKEYEVDKNFEAIVDYFKALSQILLHLPNVSSHQVNIVTQLSVQFTKRFPELKSTFKIDAVNALKNTFLNISQLEQNFQREYFSSFFRQGILWSCSHMLSIDVEIKKEIGSFSDHPVCYKDYLPLWEELFNIEHQVEFSRFLILQILNEFVNVLIAFIDKLNLKTIPQEDNFFSNPFFLLQAENETDFRFFVNLVDLYVNILEKIDSLLIQNWIEKLLIYFMKYSYKYPLVSGFYKLIDVIFKKPENFSDYQKCFNKSTCKLFIQYLSNVLELICGFSDELQLSCIYLIFNAPTFFIKALINQVIPVFKIAFNIGLTDLRLAFSALDTLENWSKSSDIQYSDKFLNNIVAFMEPYLSSQESSVNIFQGVTKKKKENIKGTTIFSIEENLETLQKRILLFYGSLDSNVLSDFIHEKSLSTNASWNKKNHLPFELLFPDIRLEIYFDKFIPRIIELTKSGDRKTKVSACELLHTIITVILGKKLMDQCFNKNLCHVVLQLSADPDGAIRNLYHPLVMQLTHYLSSRLMKESRIPQEFIDVLFDGLTEEFNSSLRDYCGLYLKEFMQWSIKQSRESDLTNLLNIRGIVRKITNFALYPSSKKCLAAAIAFNHLYDIFKENKKVVNTHWLEFLHAFVKSMEECSDIQVVNALCHVEQVIKENSSILNAKFSKRRKPLDFPDETLKGALKWLFSCCGSVNTKCRYKCMELFENLYPCVSNNEPIKDVINKIDEIALKDVEADFECITINNAQFFIRSIDFYIWIIKKKFVPLADFTIFKCSGEKNDIFFKCFSKFVSIIVSQNLETFIQLYANSLSEAEELINLESEITLKILDFISTVLLEKEIELKSIPWDDNLYLLITYSTLYPSKVGITDKMLHIIEKLPNQLENLLTLMMRNLSDEYLIKSRKCFLAEANENFLLFVNIRNIINLKEDIYNLKQFVKGLSIMKRSRFFDFEKEKNFTISYSKEVITKMFDGLKIQIMDNDSCKVLDVHVKDYLEELMKFILEDYQPEVVKFLVTLIIDQHPLISSNGSTTSHGVYFLETFKEPLFTRMLKCPIETMKILDEFFMEQPDEIFIVIEEMLVFTERNKARESEILSDEVIKKCNSFRRFLNDIDNRKAKFFNINRLAITLKNKPTEAIKTNGSTNEFYSWILEELVLARDLERKLMILENFLVCLADQESTETNYELLLVFRQLRNRDSTFWLHQLKSDDLKRFQASSCLQVLLKMLSITKSLTLYQAVIEYAAGTCESLFKDSNINKFIETYIINIHDTNALKSLHLAYKIFMDYSASEDRLDILKHFLLPTMEFSKACIVGQFYEEKCHEMVSYILKKVDSRNVMDRKKLIVTKIGCYNILELMFAKFDLQYINIEDPVTKRKKPLNQILVQHSLEVRCFSTEYEEEKEVARLLHCAGFNCCIAFVSRKEEEKFYKYIFLEDRKKDQIIWEKIIDCEKEYNFRQSSSTIRKDRKTLINIRRSMKNDQNSDQLMTSYFPRYDLTSLTLLEDVHAYDFNDTMLLAQAKAKPKTEEESRLALSFESDELNNHECMPMITGVLVHMFNNEIARLPDSSEQVNSDNLPEWLKLFRNAFCTQKDNVRMYLMKIIANTKNAFLPYIKAFFPVLAGSVACYLKRNPLNYIVRDILIIVIEAKLELSEEAEKKAAQQLVQHLIERIQDPYTSIFKYNLEILESLWSLWANQLQCPQNLEDTITSEPDLAVRVILIIFRIGGAHASDLASRASVRQLVTSSVQNWKHNESSVLLKFEALGWLLSLADDQFCEPELIKLISLFSQIERQSRERCAQCVCALYKACRSESKCAQFLRFANPWCVADNHKPECLELFLQRLPNLDPIRLPAELVRLNLKSVLRDRILGCEAPGLRILERLVPVLTNLELEPYIELTTGFVRSNSLVEYRRLAYGILMSVYDRFTELCAKHLIAALAEPDEELQALVLKFWRERVRLPDTSSERLLALLSMYRPELRDGFARFLCLLMLELTGKSLDNGKVMFAPLTDCRFEDYEVLVPRRRMNLGSMAPLFAPSMASQLSQLGQLSQFSSTRRSTFAATMRLLATLDPEYQASNDQVVTRKIPDPSQNKLSKRLVTTPSELSSIQSEEAVRRRSEYHEKLKQEAERQRNSARIYRKYRIGDFPDVEITHATFVESVRQFIMKDWLSCKDLAVVLICNFIDRLKGSDKYEGFMACLAETFRRVLLEPEERNHFTPVALEVMCYSKELDFDAISVRKICMTMTLDPLGILLLEEEHIHKELKIRNETEPPPAKRMRPTCVDNQNWIELASLYKSIGETDVVNSIFKRPGLFSDDLRQGVLAQAEGNWSAAKESYDFAWEIAIGSEKEHCLEGMFECMSQLSSWGEINKKVDILLNGNFDAVWEHPRRNQLLPWIFKAQLHQALDDFTANKDLENSSFIMNFGSWIQKREAEMKKLFGEQMSVFFLCGEKTEEKAPYCLKCCLDHAREQWIHLSPLSEKTRMKILLKLRGVYNIDTYIKTLKSPDIEEGTRELIQYWDRRLPSLNEDLLGWNMHVSYRLTFLHLLHEKLNALSEESSALNDLLSASIRQRMRISELAIKNKNKAVAKKHTARIERISQEIENFESSQLNYDFMLIAAKYKFLCGDVETSMKNKCKYYVKSWKIADDIMNDENANFSTKINVKHHLFDVTSFVKNLAEKSQEFCSLIRSNTFVTNSLGILEDQEIFEALHNYIFNNLKNVCELGSNVERANSYTKFGKYCYSLLHSTYNRDTVLPMEFISSILKGMSLGSLEAAHYFPCLLKPEYYRNNEEAVELFISKSANVPSWLFLSWQAQIMSYLGEPLARLLIPIVQRLIREYPNGIIYNFRLTYEAASELRMNSDIRMMYESLFCDSRMETFLEAMHRICQPEHYLRHHLMQLLNSSENFPYPIDSLVEKVFTKYTGQNQLQGPLYSVLDKFQTELEKLKCMDFETTKNYLQKISSDLYRAMKKRLDNVNRVGLQLKDYSLYLGNFSGKDFEVEVPGQYSGDKKPLPRYHTKISKFDRYVTVMESKCNPIKISIVGNDAQTYNFLVKFGEDLRQDQRLQQIFSITNKTLNNDITCKQRYLSTSTYNVVPLSTFLGLIQWVDGTKSFKEFVEFSMTDKQILEVVTGKYSNWIQKAGGAGHKTNCYKEALIKYNPEDVISKMKEFINHIDWDCLKKTFVMLSPSLESFVSLRNNFIKSYATMCIIHWITGVGDRHLENTLIEVKTGKCCGIDFGLAFGTGIDQSVPELVPFRLTAQILGLLKPFDEKALLGVTMTHVLSALRKEKGPILACLDIFIHEPLDWNKYLNKRLQDDEKQQLDVKWLPRRKIATVEKKLNGMKPSTIMLEELSNNHDDTDDSENKYFSKYEHIVNGTDCRHETIRSKMNQASLTPEKQVQCLLDQATDLNVLGRMYVGWLPFV